MINQPKKTKNDEPDLPRKTEGDKLDKVVSKNISSENFAFLEKDMRVLYKEYHIVQPTISHMVRAIIKLWIAAKMKEGKVKSSQYHMLV